MTKPTPHGTLRYRFDELARERRQTWPASQLAINATQRETLVRAHPDLHHARQGDVVPDAILRDRDGGTIPVSRLAVDGPFVLIFFRFAGCPACNIALPYYRDTLFPALAEKGVRLVAVSPQPFPSLNAIVEHHALPFAVLQDPGLALARGLGITYLYDADSQRTAEAKGDTPRGINGLNVWELPKPAIIAISRDRVITFIDISPDWMDRTESETVLSALDID